MTIPLSTYETFNSGALRSLQIFEAGRCYFDIVPFFGRSGATLMGYQYRHSMWLRTRLFSRSSVNIPQSDRVMHQDVLLSIPVKTHQPRVFLIVGQRNDDGLRATGKQSGSRHTRVVLSHGAGGNTGIWMYQTPVLATKYRVITWDQRGWGRSTNESGQGGNPTTAVADLKALLDLLGIEKAHLVGQSMGGWAAADFAIAYPQRTLSLTLANTYGGLATIDDDILESYGKNVARAAAAGRPANADIADPERTFQFRQIQRLAPSRVTLYREGDGVEGSWLKLHSSDSDKKLEQAAALDLPILIITGTYDLIFPPSVMQQLHKALPNSTLHEIKTAAHSPYFERPEIWNKIVLDHLAGSK